MNKPYSQACENNKNAILQKIETVFSATESVWEIGSGTGQHACYFAEHLPHLIWQTTDRQENLAGINSWIDGAGLSNLPASLVLDVNNETWPCQSIQALFTANTLHIMSLLEVKCLIEKLERYLEAQAKVCIYGPFNYQGKYTSPSNEQFDGWLKSRDPQSGIRDIEVVIKLAEKAGLIMQDDFTMPANNRLLVFEKN